MKNDLKGVLKEEIVMKSIEVLRDHGMNDEEIKTMMMEKFSLDQETVYRLIKLCNQRNV